MNITNKSLVKIGTKIKTWYNGEVKINALTPDKPIENHIGHKATIVKLPRIVNKSYMLEIKANGKTLVCTPDTLLLTPINKKDNEWKNADSFIIGDKVVMEGGDFPIESVHVLLYTCSQMVYGIITSMSKSFIANDFYVRNY